MTEIYFGVNKKSKIYIYTSLIPELIIVIIGDSNNFKMFVSKMVNGSLKIYIYPFAG